MILHHQSNFLRENQFLNITGKLTAPYNMSNALLQWRLLAKL